jgi:Cysteine-rich secretory protein family
MPVLSTTRNAFAALFCAACAAGCAQSAGGPGVDFGPENPVDASGPVPEAAARSVTSSDDASSAGDDATAPSGSDDASAPPSPNPKGRPDAGGSSSMSTPDAGTNVTPMTFGDGGPCTPNLSCMLSPPPSTGDIRTDCVNRINQFRTTCACMKPLARWTAGEACADMDAQYDSMKMSGHAGFIAMICQPEGYSQDECPGDPSEQYVISGCLQQMWSEGPPPAGTTIAQCESQAMYATCYEAHGHFINMTDPNVTKVACGFYTTSSGAVWAVQNLSP